jgi:hypothetical protein
MNEMNCFTQIKWNSERKLESQNQETFHLVHKKRFFCPAASVETKNEKVIEDSEASKNKRKRQ